MEELFLKLAAQVPALTVLAILVIVFTRDRAKHSERIHTSFRDIAQSCHEHGEKLDDRYKECVDCNTRVLEEVHKAIGENTAYLKKQNGNN